MSEPGTTTEDPLSPDWIAGHKAGLNGVHWSHVETLPPKQRKNWMDGWLTGDAEKDCSTDG